MEGEVGVKTIIGGDFNTRTGEEGGWKEEEEVEEEKEEEEVQGQEDKQRGKEANRVPGRKGMVHI